MKKTFLLIALSLCFSLFAATGVVSGEKNLRVSKTQWFDLIYPERCEKTAAILYENVDAIYSEVTEQYGLEPVARIPVVITPAVENLNAYWAVLPYSHIVLYDTSFENIGELAVFSETLLSIFRHELTHAVTYTMKNAFWSRVTQVFGDAMNIGPLLVSSGMAEGATVSSESMTGEGRLNNEYAKHNVKQAKIEGKFPSYYGVQGTGDLNPYYYNGAFHEWLQKNYGMEAYAKFWYYTINVQGLTVRWRFKKAFGEKLDVAWKKFISDYEVPLLAANPVIAKEAKDYFIPDTPDYSRKNDAGSKYVSLTSSDNCIYWIDAASRGIFASGKKLFTQTGAYAVSPSKDNKYVAVSCYADDKAATYARVKIYDTETKQYFTVKEKGLKSAAVVKKSGEYYLVASKFETPENTIQIFKILTEKGRIKEIQAVAKVILPLNIFACEFTSLENGFAYIKKDKLSYSICISDLEGQVTQEYVLPQERIVINSLNAEDNTLYFSWTQKGTMPRLGTLNLENGQLGLSGKDLSGGIFSPVASEGKVVYIGKFLNQNRILTLEADSQMDYSTVKNQIPDLQEEKEQAQVFEYTIPESEKFNSFKYLNRGLLIPLSTFTSENFGPNYGKTPDTDMFIGVSYFTGAPWSDGTSDSLFVTGGWNILTNSAGLEAVATFGTDTSLLKSSTDVKTEINLKGWKYSSVSETVSTGFHFGKTSLFQFKNVLEAKVGKQYKWIETKKFPFYGYYERDDISLYYDLFENALVSYSNVHYSGPGTYERCGIVTSLGAYYVLDGAFNNSLKQLNAFDLYGGVAGYIPRLLPFESHYGSTTNFPSVVGLKILNSNANAFSVYEVYANTVLLGMLIKKPVPFFNGIYLQNWKITGGYSGVFEPLASNIRTGSQFINLPGYTAQIFKGQFTYLDSVSLQADLKISPNMGALSRNEFQIDFLATANYAIHQKSKTANPFSFDFSINVSY